MNVSKRTMSALVDVAHTSHFNIFVTVMSKNMMESRYVLPKYFILLIYYKFMIHIFRSVSI